MRAMSMTPNRGFTLLEMAVVLMIIGLLLGGLIPTLSAQRESQQINETRKQMDDIQQALFGYALAHGRLPCPAQATLATGATDAGNEATIANSCACKTPTGSDNTIADSSASKVACPESTVTGVLPWATLGINETDAWGRRYTYRVTHRFADQIIPSTTDCTPAIAVAPTASSFALCSPGVPNVLATSGGVTVATDVPAVIVSHGKNGCGAYLSTGSPISPLIDVGNSSGSSCDNAGADQVENADNNISFVSKDFSPSYDDIVIWLSPNTLVNRMVAAGKLP